MMIKHGHWVHFKRIMKKINPLEFKKLKWGNSYKPIGQIMAFINEKN